MRQHPDTTVAVTQITRPTRCGDSSVLTEKAAADGGQPIRVDWKVNNAKGKNKIVDVRIEGVSMSVTQREEFTTVIRQNNGDINVLLKALRKKAAYLKSK